MPKFAEKTTLTDNSVNALKPAPKGTRYTTYDKLVDGFGVRVTDSGHGTYIIVVRGRRRKIGDVGKIKLGDARDTARGWLISLAKGVEPGPVKPAASVATAAPTGDALFRDVAEDF